MAAFGKQPPRPRLDIGEIIDTAHNLQDRLEDRVVEAGGLSDYQALTLALKIRISDLDQKDRDVQDENIHGAAVLLSKDLNLCAAQIESIWRAYADVNGA